MKKKLALPIYVFIFLMLYCRLSAVENIDYSLELNEKVIVTLNDSSKLKGEIIKLHDESILLLLKSGLISKIDKDKIGSITRTSKSSSNHQKKGEHLEKQSTLVTKFSGDSLINHYNKKATELKNLKKLKYSYEIPGNIFCVSGAVVLAGGLFYAGNDNETRKTIVSIGAGIVIVSIPLLIYASILRKEYKKSSHELEVLKNQICETTFNFIPVINPENKFYGIGLSINF